MVNRIFHKTEAGQDEIRTRARKLDQKLRAVLLLINGERGEEDILAQVSGMGIGPDALDTLSGMGLIQADGVAAASILASTPTTELPAVAAPAITVQPQQAATATPGTALFQDVYQYFTAVIGEHLGLRGYLMQMKVEKAGTLDELLALRSPLHGALSKAKGDVGAVAILDQLDDLLEAGKRGAA